MNAQISIENGKYFNKPMILYGYVMMILGVMSFFESLSESPSFLMATVFMALPSGAALAFAKQGVQINAQNKMYRNFFSFLGLKFGKWESFSHFAFVSILKTRIKETVYGGRTSVSMDTIKEGFNICLLSQNHRHKVILQRLDSLDDARERLAFLSDFLQLETVQYQPPISAASRRRARRRRS